jgi:hypothetical protein
VTGRGCTGEAGETDAVRLIEDGSRVAGMVKNHLGARPFQLAAERPGAVGVFTKLYLKDKSGKFRFGTLRSWTDQEGMSDERS